MPLCPRCGEENPERARYCSACGSALGTAWTAAIDTRKVVTVLFADVTGSTALGERADPESVRTVMLRIFDAARDAVERHGGTVEKFIGDAVLAVFGVPWAHEDDALRALRAAVELRGALGVLNEELEPRYEIRLDLRMGIASGEAAVGADGLVVGDPVTLAARLEPDAAPGEILLDGPTRLLVRDAVEVEEAGSAWRLLAIVGDAPFARRLDTPLVGRESELARLRDAYSVALEERACRLVTVLGPAGIGKSRLVRELVTSLPGDARVLFGRCLPYGEGITYWPVADVVRAAAGIEAGTDAADAVGRIAALLPDAGDAALVADRVAAAIGLREAAVTPEEISWAVRRLVEALAAARPLVLIVDDVHWAEPTFLDLVEHLADRTRAVPVLLLCTARPELHEAHPGWAEARGDAALVELEPLDDAESARLIDHLETGTAVGAGLRARVAAAAGGNPLFLEAMLAMLGEDGRRNGDEVALPPTIQALLAARLDRLGPQERDVIGRASVIGQEFTRDAVAELAGGRAVAPLLETLVVKELLRPADGGTPGERFEFRHLLIRDAAYAALSKELRADLHERYARSLVRVAGARLGEVEELVGYQLEQAYAHRIALAPLDEGARSLAAEAAGHLQASGARASARGDLPAAAGLLERALALLADDDPRRAELQAFAGATLLELGRLERAELHLTGAHGAARDSGARALELSAGMALSVLHAQSDPTFNPVAAAAGAEQAIPELERLHADAALAGVWRLLVIARLIEHDPAALEHAATRALEASRRLRHARGEAEALFWLSLAIAIGPTPVEDGLRRCEELRVEAPGPLGSAAVDTVAGWLRACLGDVDEGRLLVRRGRDGFRELGFVLYAESSAHAEATVELHAGDLAAVERVLREGSSALEAVGETASLANQRGLLAWTLARLGRPEEALEWSEVSRRLAAARVAQAYWRRGRSLALARLDRLDEALELAREAVGVIEGTGDLHSHAEMLEHLAEIELEAGLGDDAARALAQAAALYGQKGCRVCVARLAAG